MSAIHREGYRIIALIIAILAIINIVLTELTNCSLYCILISIFISLLVIIFILRFFRKPARTCSCKPGIIYAPADGTIVAKEEVYEPEYFKDKRLQVSIFMSVWNVHINWYPITGRVEYYKYHPGKYLLARHPKSSTLNERTSLAVKCESGHEVLVRQIAGIAARRIVCYSTEEMNVFAGKEMGFIKFGSRVDLFLPLNTEILVNPGEKVRGCITQIGILK